MGAFVDMPASGWIDLTLGRPRWTGGHFFWNVHHERDFNGCDDRHRRILVSGPHGCPLRPCGLLFRRGVCLFLFFSNRTGLAGSVLISLLLSAILLYACSA